MFVVALLYVACKPCGFSDGKIESNRERNIYVVFNLNAAKANKVGQSSVVLRQNNFFK